MRLLLFLLTIAPILSLSQIYSIDDYNISLSDDASVSDFYQNTYYNSYDSLNVSWNIISSTMPPNWDYSICFPMCNPIGVSSGNLLFNPNTQNYLNCHFYPNNTPGTGIIKMEITTNNNFIDTVIWTGTATSSLSLDEYNSFNKRELILITDIMGRETDIKYNIPLIFRYDDGTIERRIVLK